jgi:signal transduction histidine kinase
VGITPSPSSVWSPTRRTRREDFEARNVEPAWLRCQQAVRREAALPITRDAGTLDAGGAMTHYFLKSPTGRTIILEARQVETLREKLERLRREVRELRASRERLALSADADRRRIERELHDGPQQHLVALAVNLQRARRLVDVDPAAARTLLDEMGRDVQEALDETQELSHRIYPPLLEVGGLGVALRSTAATLGVPTRVKVAAITSCPPEVAGTVYFCCVQALEHLGAGGRSTTITVREEERALVFEIVADGSGVHAAGADLSSVQERVEALGGRLTIASEPGHGIRVSGSVPMSR